MALAPPKQPMGPLAIANLMGQAAQQKAKQPKKPMDNEQNELPGKDEGKQIAAIKAKKGGAKTPKKNMPDDGQPI